MRAIGERGRRLRESGELFGPLADAARAEGCVGKGRACQRCGGNEGKGCSICGYTGLHRCVGPIEVDHPTTRGMGSGRTDWLDELVLQGGAECQRATGCSECEPWDGQRLHHAGVVPLHEGCTCSAIEVRVGNCIGACRQLHRPWLTSNRILVEQRMGIDTVQLARELGERWLASQR